MIYKCVLVTLDLLWFEGFIWSLCFWLSGGRMGDRSPPDDPCPPGLGGLGQKVEIFDGSPLLVPVGTGVPTRSLAGEPEAGFLLTGLLGSSSELSWWPRFDLALMLSISLSSSEAADASCWAVSGDADLKFEIVGWFICSGIIWVDPGNWEAELVQRTLIWIDFWFLMLSSRFNRESMVCVSQSSSDLKLFGDVMPLVHWCGLVTLAYELLDGSVDGPSTCCLASWKGMLFLKFYFEDFFLSFPLGANFVVCGMITIAICTFSFILTCMILMPWLSAFCTFLFIFAESFVMTILLAIEAPLGIGYIHFCVSNEKANLYFLGDFLAIYCQNIWICRYQPSICSPLHSFVFCNSLFL